MKHKTDREPIVLIDDPVSELDEQHWARLSELLTSLPAQQFITLIDSRYVPRTADYGVFHVEQEPASRMV
jgi:recombinational DNA repair ATPase RecF